MSRYKAERFNFSDMSERITFQTRNSDGTFSDSLRVWAHFLKDGFTRTEEENWFKIIVREQKALETVLDVGTRITWKNMTLSLFSWQDPSYEDRGFLELMAKQIPTTNGNANGPTDNSFFKDIVSVYTMKKTTISQYGIETYKYNYDFSKPDFTGIRCLFSTDRNRYLEDKTTDVEHDSLIVKFNIDAPIKVEDYIESSIHGRFKVDMVVKNNDNMLEVHVQRREVQ